ncbi:hypothetical protein BDF14DRAFT_1804194 [Spinellus fusiger]|nr:hypothetical protein BDF14DRAFT_1804194 [Spinellus fusiger]
MPPVTPKDSKKRSILDVKSSRITKKPVTRASLLRKERTALSSSQRTDSRPPAGSGLSPSQTIKKPSGEPRRSGTSTTRLPVATPLALKAPRIQPRRQKPIVSRSSQTEQPDTTISNIVAAGTKRKSVETPRIQPRKQNPIMPRSSKPEQPATTISDTVAARTKNISSKSLDTNVKKRYVLNKKVKVPSIVQSNPIHIAKVGSSRTH